jgi:uncharacterized protein affecting Mg2+/Co2+ transport
VPISSIGSPLDASRRLSMLILCYRKSYEAGVTGIQPEMECRARYEVLDQSHTTVMARLSRLQDSLDCLDEEGNATQAQGNDY